MKDMKKESKNPEKNYSIDLQNVSKTRIPPHRLLKTAAFVVLKAMCKRAQVCIRIVDEQESAMLNRKYRGKQGPTNVLAFSYHQLNHFHMQHISNPFPQEATPASSTPPILSGDLVICAPVVRKEAKEQGKSLAMHFSHLIIHGTLHLLGFDHETDEQAQAMEPLEIKFLKKLGFANPY